MWPRRVASDRFVIYQRRWTPLRSLTEYDDVTVSIAKNRGGKPCGWVRFSDRFEWPEGFAGFDSPINCYGISFSINVRTAFSSSAEPRKAFATKRVAVRLPERLGTKKAPSPGPYEERMMGLEPTTFCMASRRSSQLSYIRTRRPV